MAFVSEPDPFLELQAKGYNVPDYPANPKDSSVLSYELLTFRK